MFSLKNLIFFWLRVIHLHLQLPLHLQLHLHLQLAIIALTLLKALHRELHTRDPSARRDQIVPAGHSPSPPWGLQGSVLPHAQRQGPALPHASSFEDLGRGSDMLGG